MKHIISLGMHSLKTLTIYQKGWHYDALVPNKRPVSLLKHWRVSPKIAHNSQFSSIFFRLVVMVVVEAGVRTESALPASPPPPTGTRVAATASTPSTTTLTVVPSHTARTRRIVTSAQRNGARYAEYHFYHWVHPWLYLTLWKNPKMHLRTLFVSLYTSIHVLLSSSKSWLNLLEDSTNYVPDSRKGNILWSNQNLLTSNNSWY